VAEIAYVFYVDNAPHTASYHKSACDVIRAMNFVPLIYRGITLTTRTSSVDREIREDFYKSKIVILLLGVGNGWLDMRDNWVFPELAYAASAGMRILAYLTEEVGQTEVDSLGLPVSYGIVGDEASFAKLLAEDLRRYTPVEHA
jgi:hypothetical protein